MMDKDIDNLRGKHVKQALSRLERLGPVDPQVRKIILDEINDLVREILRTLGYTVED